MLPNFYNGQIICLYEDFYKSESDVNYGDVIGFNLKTKWNFIKRIIAIPWDKIIFWKDWFIYKNWKKLNENYTLSSKKFSINSLALLLKQLEYYNNIVPEGMFLVMWDNRQNSIDSTDYWLIDFEHIIGKVEKTVKWYCF